MQITKLLGSDQVAVGTLASSKKRVLERLSELLARGADNLNATDIFDCLLARERLGSTGLGHGIAIPHARMKGNQHTLAALICLDQGIDFDAVDEQPVDIFCALLVPEESTQIHVQLLARLAEMFRDPELCAYLREAKDPNVLLETLREWERNFAPSNVATK
ncbi:PTS sugar transporter subunit IIA [Nitrosococcus oceani]|uniref:PTS IIA-like nitrogen-regulatory protein PtsN n=2 Tax=Nitrosococcus oceani TaxID=1229 RepID=Q3J7F4_NITOC|nr:PTS sugar transporter subunit IIA [Nitrosococcus oceani]KFI18270.1 PTS sugar transporter subunit IIA [Nitrosococcus oceani C-27]ABA59242.1 PTS IIA-like nitrogen-regulatory protein PtsN [Nitrosococcus oceani ATCC 19707]EDZ66397.1 phosphoenolpyruvate-dependent sugar phosphotransferase system, EIIA 2, putative [Nitrosococcus oceani AFC27]KFI21448.1 PTS sugar transporter subunit IIA [Nitrosococcus oceani]GEM21067.1 PTS sugar transporter subunit IIA [Nitrosococcus oceani]